MCQQLDGFGNVKRNVRIPDKDTGQVRQINGLIEFENYGKYFRIVIEAKFHKNKINVRHVESSFALADSVNADGLIIVTPNGCTKPALEKAKTLKIDIKIWTVEEALNSFIPDNWIFCPICKNDCIILNNEGAIEFNHKAFWWLAGQCRECGSMRVYCQGCGEKFFIKPNESHECWCGFTWTNKDTFNLELSPPNAKNKETYIVTIREK